MRTRLAALAAVSIVAAACGTSGPAGSSTAATAAPSAETTGSNSAPSPPSEATTTTTPPATTAPFDEDQLKSALLAVTDMPTGWSASSSEDTAGKGLCNKPSINDQLPPVANVKADFVMGTDVPAFLEQLLSYPDVDTARQVLETFDADAKSCTTYNQDGVAFTVGQLSFPSMGDQSVAYRINVSQSGVSVTADTAVVRKDAVVLYAAYFDFATDTAEAVALTTQAYDKMVQTLHLG